MLGITKRDRKTNELIRTQR